MITSKENTTYKLWMKLKQKKYRTREQLFLIEGEHLVIEAQKADAIVEVLVCEGINFNYAGAVTYLAKPLFEKLSLTVSSAGVMAVCRIKEQELARHHRLLLVDDLRDPGNLGTLIRSALAFGFDGLIMSETTVDVYNDKVIRATQGAMFHLPMRVANLEDYILDLRGQGVEVYATTLTEDAKPMDAISQTEKMAFIVGNEGAGISCKLVDACDGSIVIEMSNMMESLNVGVAGSILMQKFNGLGKG